MGRRREKREEGREGERQREGEKRDEGRRENGGKKAEVKGREKSTEVENNKEERVEQDAGTETFRHSSHLVSPIAGSMMTMMVRKIKDFLMMVCSRNDL